MKFFGHHIARLFLLFAALDGALFIGALHLLSMTEHCQYCSFASVADLPLYKSLLLTGAFLLMTTSLGLYNSDTALDFRTFAKRFVLAWQLVFLIAVIFVGFTKAAAGLPFGWYVGLLSLAISIFMLCLFVVRVVLVWCFGLSFIKRRILVLGEGQAADEVVKFIEGTGSSHLHLVGAVRTVRAAKRSGPAEGNLALKVEKTEAEPQSLSAMARELRPDEIVVAMQDKRGQPIDELLECKLAGINVIDALTFWEREAGQIDFSNAGFGWLTFSSGFVLDQPRRILKRGADIVVSLAFLIFILPLTLAVALAIKLESRGPIFYRQERVGLNGRVFKVWKFRSMRTDAERDGPQWAKSSDDRVTRIGRFIRKVRIDEVPQIINVLAGDMSFIGPRPERPFFVDQLQAALPYYHLRHRVRPGITGWAQVNYPYGASIEDAKKKLSYDLYYLKKNDLLLDFAILVQTVRVILFASGAR